MQRRWVTRTLTSLRDLLWYDPFVPCFLKGLFVINFLGSLYGYYWYGQQLKATPRLFWIFTPDSPLSTSLFTVSLALWYIRGRRSARMFRGRNEGVVGTRRAASALEVLSCASVIKYGLWAVVVITDYWLRGGQPALLEALLLLSHLGMAAEGYIFLRHLAFSFKEGALAGGWLLLNDYVDYGLGFHPYLFLNDQVALACTAASVLTAVWFLYSLGRKTSGDTEY